MHTLAQFCTGTSRNSRIGALQFNEAAAYALRSDCAGIIQSMPLTLRRLAQVGRAAWFDVIERLRSALVPRHVHHLHGPERIDREADDLLVITVVRNGAPWLHSFFDHYTRLGVSHFLVLDNGSTDGTIEFLKRRRGVTLLCTSLRYSSHENLMKRYLARTYSRGKWNLFVDVDELFDYPCSSLLDLRGLLKYLRHHGYTAVVAQMLDMFSNEPLTRQAWAQGDSLRDYYRHFDISNIEKTPYEFAGPLGSPIHNHSGGIRKTVFGTTNGLTKAPLTFLVDKLETFIQWHHTRNGNVADISCVLLHYPFLPNFVAKVEEAARTGRYGPATTDEYRAYWKGTSVADRHIPSSRHGAAFRGRGAARGAALSACVRPIRQLGETVSIALTLRTSRGICTNDES